MVTRDWSNSNWKSKLHFVVQRASSLKMLHYKKKSSFTMFVFSGLGLAFLKIKKEEAFRLQNRTHKFQWFVFFLLNQPGSMCAGGTLKHIQFPIVTCETKPSILYAICSCSQYHVNNQVKIIDKSKLNWVSFWISMLTYRTHFLDIQESISRLAVAQ